ELEGIVEHVLVAVGRGEVERDLFAGWDRHAVDLDVLGSDAREVADRADPAKDLLDRLGQQLAAGAQLLPLAWVFSEGEDGPADGVARRLVAGLDKELGVGE